jgi:uridine kinase
VYATTFIAKYNDGESMNSPHISHSSFDDILRRIEGLRQKKSQVIVAIDGRGGAGKSSLARALVSRLSRSAHIEHDWFHLPKVQVLDAHRFDHARLISEVISPFQSGTPKLNFLRYNWCYLAGIPDGFHATPIAIEDKEILVIEGCETLHQALVPYLDLAIWVDTDPKVSLERGIRRDIDEYKLDPQTVNASWKEWSAWEAERLAHDDRRSRADIFTK